MKSFDYIIIGGGPTGLTLATLYSKKGKVLLLEKYAVLGGCHSVCRSNELFSEHSPRIYSNNYVSTISFLKKELDIKWDDYFTKYEFQLIDTLGTIKLLSIKEIIILIFMYLYNFIFKLKGNVSENLINFNKEFKEKIDTICRITDGVDSSRYPISQLFELPNQHLFYSLFQPKIDNDIGLFKIWEEKLIEKNVTIIKNYPVKKLDILNLMVNEQFIGKNIILACGLETVSELTNEKFNLKQLKYNNYFSVTFHWKNKIDLPKVKWLKNTTDSLVYVITSNYNNSQSTIISTVLTNPKKGTSSDISWNNLKQVFPNIPNYDIKSECPFNFDAYITSNLPNKLRENLFICGCYNGNSNYPFTSLESAIQNAINLTKDSNLIKSRFTLNKAIILIILIILIYKLR